MTVHSAAELKRYPQKFDVVIFDPGKRTGLSFWLWEPGTCFTSRIADGLDALQAELDNLLGVSLKFLVVERYIPDRRAKRADLGEALQVIGMVKAVGRMSGTPVIEQMPGDRLMAAKWAEVKVPKGHMPDDMSAYLHGYFFMRQHHRIRQTPLERRANASR